MLVHIFFIALGFLFLIKGADLLVDGASSIAKRFHIPEIVIGLTIVSIGTSMPELFVSTTSALNDSADMAIGNIIGSNICNLLLILGVSAAISPVKFQKDTVRLEIPMCFACTAVFMLLCNVGGVLSRVDATILMVLFVGFIGYTIYVAKKGLSANAQKEQEEEEPAKKSSILKDILFVVIGIVGLKFGGDFTVDHAAAVATQLGVSEKVIGLTVLAIGTSLPELVTSVVAAIKGNDDIAIGNIIGSNMFNMLMIIGVTGLITPLQYNLSYNLELGILLGSLVLLEVFAWTKPKNKMSRLNGIIYTALYIAYMVVLFVL